MRKLACFIMFGIFACILSSCNYKDLDKTLFVTAVIIDKGKDAGKSDIYFEAFRPSSSSSQQNQQGEKIVYGVKNKDILQAADELNKLANLPVSFAQTKIVLFTRAAAEEGLDLHVDFFTHADDFTIRTYLAIWDGDPKEFDTLEMKGEKFLGLYLRTHIENAEKRTSHVQRITMLDLMNSAQIKGKIVPLAIFKPVKQGETQLIDISEVALVREFKMVGSMSAQESDVTNYVSGKVKTSFVDVENPDVKGENVLLSTISCTTKTDVNQKNDGMEVIKTIKITTIIRGAAKHITKDKATVEKIKSAIKEKGLNLINDIYKKYSNQGLDVYNLGESIYRKYPWFDQTDLFNKVDFKINLQVEIQGTNYKLDFNPEPKHNQKK